MDTEIQPTAQDHRPISEGTIPEDSTSSLQVNDENSPVVKEDDNFIPTSPVLTDEKGAAKSEKKKRLSITVNFPIEESEYVQAIIEARMKSGLTTDNGHFIRQCVDFAIHMEKLHGRHQAGFSFATPADLPITYLKGGFFKQK